MFNQLKRIQKLGQTLDQDIESYGSFVAYAEGLNARISKSKRRGWTNSLVARSKCNKAVPAFHKALMDKHGMEGLQLALNAHPFK